MRGVLNDNGIDDDFAKALANLLRPGQAALLLRRDLMTEQDMRDQVIEKLASSGGRVLRTDLTPDQDPVARGLRGSLPFRARRGLIFA